VQKAITNRQGAGSPGEDSVGGFHSTDDLPIGRQHVLGRILTGRTVGDRIIRLGFAAVAIALGLKHVPDLLAPPTSYLKDFLQEYVMARAALAGTDPYLPADVLAKQFAGHLDWVVFPHPSPHPPPVALLFIPLSLLSYATAANAWLVLGLIFLILSVYLLARALAVRLPLWGAILVVVGSLSWTPIYDDIIWGNMNSIMLLLLVGAWASSRSARSATGGLLLGSAILIKPIPWPLVLLFAARREWRSAISACCTVAAGYIFSGLVLGPQRVVEYVTNVIPSSTAVYHGFWQNVSLWSIGWRFFQGTSRAVVGQVIQAQITAPPLVSWPGAAPVVAVAVPVAVLVLTVALTWRHRDFDTAFSLMLCTSILISPVSWEHYQVMLAIPIALAIVELVRRGFPSSDTNAALVVAVLLITSLPMWGSLAFLVSGQARPLNFYGTVPFVASLLTLGPTVATMAVGWLVWRRNGARLGPRAGSRRDAIRTSRARAVIGCGLHAVGFHANRVGRLSSAGACRQSRVARCSRRRYLP
jgi:alpha-1,2-mannosyltransferase